LIKLNTKILLHPIIYIADDNLENIRRFIMRKLMKYKAITDVLDRLKKIEFIYEDLIKKFKNEKGKKTIASPCFFIPPEINSAFDIVTLKIPEFILNDPSRSEKLNSLYDAVIIPEKECFCSSISSEITAHIFRTPAGFGEDAAVSLHNEIASMLKELFGIELKSINIETLQNETSTREKLRRLIRSISSLRSENRFLLNHAELSLIFETALILPPEIAIEYINPVLEEMKKISDKHDKALIQGMLYGGKTIPSFIADSIEDSGILLIEDDSCSGRRLFDISLNAESEYIFYEILDAYSYRALTPCMRSVNERYELLYKLLRNYNISTVIFFRDQNCIDSVNDIEYLRIKMMRDGIDPLVIDENNYREIVSGYVERVFP
jgi:hypothetical protein